MPGHPKPWELVDVPDVWVDWAFMKVEAEARAAEAKIKMEKQRLQVKGLIPSDDDEADEDESTWSGDPTSAGR